VLFMLPFPRAVFSVENRRLNSWLYITRSAYSSRGTLRLRFPVQQTLYVLEIVLVVTQILVARTVAVRFRVLKHEGLR